MNFNKCTSGTYGSVTIKNKKNKNKVKIKIAGKDSFTLSHTEFKDLIHCLNNVTTVNFLTSK